MIDKNEELIMNLQLALDVLGVLSDAEDPRLVTTALVVIERLEQDFLRPLTPEVYGDILETVH